ncbi:hypothetical protein J2W30_004651 [Variovorax boronicumulans]|uniref:hypothetical protein n=1 Tax=Variovorax boronicumulans TaxID=436515 RepID=UPI002787FE69|nr:hypothetical protein [Variovorax boronicumulans]MDQ0036876.1 hypothetical protein [Variovorax boronicumulans]
MEIVSTRHGTYAGVAELSLQGTRRCALVVMQQKTRDAALNRATIRAGHFVKQWDPTRA